MFGERLKALRMEAGLSQKALATKLFISQQAVAGWEADKGSPNPETIAKISEILNVSTDYLLGLADQKETPVSETGDGLNEEQREIVKLYETASPTLRAAALAVLKSSEGQGKAPGASSTEE